MFKASGGDDRSLDLVLRKKIFQAKETFISERQKEDQCF